MDSSNLNNKNILNQAMLMRDLIDFRLESNGNVSNLEYASCFAHYIDEIIESNNSQEKNINWNELFSNLDEEYTNLHFKKPSNPKYLTNLQNLYNKASQLIK